MENLVDWVEQAALENLRFHLKNADDLAKESATTLTILLAGIGGGMAYAVKGLEASPPTSGAIASAVLAAYLALLAGVLVFKCMKISPIPAPTNEPKNLYQPDFSLEELKAVELNNIQERIVQATFRNDQTTGWLNRIRVSAVLTPLVWALAFYLSPHLVGQGTVVG